MGNKRLEIKIDGNDAKSHLCVAKVGEGLAFSAEGDVMTLLASYGELTCNLHNSIAEKEKNKRLAGNLLQAAIRASALRYKDIDLTYFFGTDSHKFVLAVDASSGEHAETILQGGGAEICAALTCAVEACKSRLEEEFGEELAKYLMQRAWLMGVGKIQPGEEEE